MAVNIDTVYQKVLILTNKEQRGYITPQEFNLLANKAQRDIFESYFNMDKRKIYTNKTRSDDELDIFEKKINTFYKKDNITVGTDSEFDLTNSSDVYKIDIIKNGNNEVTELSQQELIYSENNPLTKAVTSRPVYVKADNNTAVYYPTTTSEITLTIHYWRRLNNQVLPNWGYVVVNGKALYNSNTSADFELHVSEEEMLVTRILELAGIIVEKPQLQQTAIVDKSQMKQEQIR
jgi:hypothetical protein